MWLLKFKGCRLGRKHNISISLFKVSYGWVRSTKASHDLTIRRQTTTAQRLPEAYEKKLVGFQTYVLKLRKDHGHLLGQTGNADQTPVF
jgi:hypothetical protein